MAPLVEKYESSLGEHRQTIGYLSERIDELELGLEEGGWIQYGAEEMDFSKAGLNEIVRRSRLMAIKNPLINRAVDVQVFYVWGQGFQFQAKDEKVQEILTDFWDNPLNQVELTSRQALEMKERKNMTEGNIFFVFFTDQAGNVVVRSLPFAQVTDVITEEGDSKVPIMYKREWEKQVFNMVSGEIEFKKEKLIYPNWRFGDKIADSYTKIGEFNVAKDARVCHVRVGGLDEMKYGVPEVYSALDWALAYKNFLEDWATIVRAHRTFAWQLINENPGGIEAAKAKLNTTMSPGVNETNPAPVVGSMFLGNANQKIEPIKTSGATVTAEDGRRLMLMAASALGFGENFFGDTKTGNLATAQTLDRPTELKITLRRELWKSVLQDVFDFVIQAKVNTGELKEDIDRTIAITFPDVLEHDIESSINSIIKAGTLDGKPVAGTVPPEVISTLLLTALGVDNVADVVEEMDFSGLEKVIGKVGEDPAPPVIAAVPTDGKPIDQKPVAKNKKEMTPVMKKALEDIYSVYRVRLGESSIGKKG